MLLSFNQLLEQAELHPKRVAILRHQPEEPALRRVLPWLAVDRPDLFHAYQQIQWKSAEKLMARADAIAAFIGQEPGRATFAGVSRITSSRKVDHAGYHALPGNAELIALGMTGMKPTDPDPLAFELEHVGGFEDWVGRLVVDWPKPDRVWCRWAGNGPFAIRTITEESRFVRGMPEWTELVLTWAELAALPRSWRASLSEWRGVYLIFDTECRQPYVGSAGGGENILGRWRNYAATGHGGNKRLRTSRPEALVFSILQRTSPDLDVSDLVRLENSWKRRLHSREHGLNEN